MSRKLKATLWFAVLCVIAVIMAWNGTLDYMGILALSAVVLIGVAKLANLAEKFIASKTCQHDSADPE